MLPFRLLLTAFVCGASVLAADTLFRTSILARVRPVVLTPVSGRVYQPPVDVHWVGPERMHLFVRPTGGNPVDLGICESPTALPPHVFPRDGSYELELRAVRFGNWIYVRQQFEVFPRPPADVARVGGKERERRERGVGLKEILRAIKASRAARERAHERLRSLAEQNAALKEESEKLVAQLEALATSQDEDTQHIERLEQQLAELQQHNRAMQEELQVLRLRLGTLPPCATWGYYAFPRPNTYPATRRFVVISDSTGRIFHSQAECELGRRSDATAGSPCFCAASPWG